MKKTRQEKIAIIKELLNEDDIFLDIQKEIVRIGELVQDLEKIRYRVGRDLYDLSLMISKLSVELEEKK